MASIQKRILQNGEISYRVQVRLKGHPIERATFARLTDAKRWAQSTEAAMRECRYFKGSLAKKHTVSEMIDRYLEKITHENPKRIQDIKPMLQWWKSEIGYYLLSDLSRTIISDSLDKLKKRTVKRRCKETGQNKYVPIK